MKLRNKKTGEIKAFDEVMREAVMREVYKWNNYTSLAELNEEWEDYEEDKYYYAITSIKADAGITKMKNIHNDMTAFDKSIGNYFETREEAEKAVEKLKAFKRLQDLGFRFEGIRFRDKHSYIEWKLEPKNELTDDETGKLLEDLYEVFGGKE